MDENPSQYFVGPTVTGGIFSLGDNYRSVVPVPNYITVDRQGLIGKVERESHQDILENGPPNQIQRANLARIAYNASLHKIKTLNSLGK